MGLRIMAFVLIGSLVITPIAFAAEQVTITLSCDGTMKAYMPESSGSEPAKITNVGVLVDMTACSS